MKSTPVIPGRAYRVTGMGLDLTVFADNAAGAIVVGIEILITQGVE
jgi:hypothetical protein